MKTIFNSNFYLKFTPPNSKELINLLSQINESECDYELNWSGKCLVDTISLKSEKWLNHLIPSLEIFSNHFSYRGAFQIEDPWLNFYSYHGFQETHHHPYCDISAVFLLNNGNQFGRFYFYDRMGGLINPNIQALGKFADTYFPEINPGDFIMFPSYILHGVTPHKSEEVRKTFSFNIRLI